MTHVQCQCGQVFWLHNGEALRVTKGRDNTTGKEWCIEHIILKIGKEVVNIK